MKRTAIFLAAAAIAAGAFAGEEAAPAGRAALDTHSQWRCWFVWGRELVQWDSGEVTACEMVRKEGLKKVEGGPALSAPPAEGWAAADFDDTDWVLSPGPIKHGDYRRDLAGLYLRGRFEVPDPGACGGLKLSVSYRGGAVVYVNGKEVARGHLPAGELKPDALAEAYPKDAYLDPDGSLLVVNWKGESKAPERVRMRTRPLPVEVPASALRKGVNVLAVEIHRAPTAEVLYTGKAPKTRRGSSYRWSMLGFESFRLEPKAGNLPLSGAVPAGTLRVWSASPIVDAWDTDGGEVRAKDAAVAIVAARNGAFSGVVTVRGSGALKNIKVEPGEMVHAGGKGKIPAAAVRVRFAVAGMSAPDGAKKRHPEGAKYLGVLAETPPAEAAGAVPVWLTVRVPADAAPGEYKGAVKIGAEGAKPVNVPVELSVADYAFPDTKAFTALANVMQSPETVAIRYGVKPWSEEHWKLLDRTFAYLGEVAPKVVFVPLVAQTNMGNEFSMVRWVKAPDGWTHDFTIAEKYLDLAVKHWGKIPVVCLYVWTPTMGGGGFAKIVDLPKNKRPMHFTVLDPKTGAMSTEQGPDLGTPESVPFWQPVFDGMRERLAARGLEKSIAVGMGSDRVPSKQALEDLGVVAPEAGWVIHAHGRYTSFPKGKPLALDASVWGVKGPFLSTYRRYKPGWANTVMSTVFPRYGAGSMGHVRTVSPIGVYHAASECYLASGYNGIGRVAADFWAVLPGKRGKTTILSRYPSWQRPGVPTMGHGVLLYPAKEGAVATVRFEALRLGVQEAEARVFVERAIRDKEKRAKLGDELAKRVQALLDERVQAIMDAKRDRSVMYSIATDASWLGYAQAAPGRARRLFDIAAEVAKKLGE